MFRHARRLQACLTLGEHGHTISPTPASVPPHPVVTPTRAPYPKIRQHLACSQSRAYIQGSMRLDWMQTLLGRRRNVMSEQVMNNGREESRRWRLTSRTAARYTALPFPTRVLSFACESNRRFFLVCFVVARHRSSTVHVGFPHPRHAIRAERPSRPCTSLLVKDRLVSTSPDDGDDSTSNQGGRGHRQSGKARVGSRGKTFEGAKEGW